MRLAGAQLRERGPLRPATSVFFGGGTPTLLPTADVIAMLEGVREVWGLTEGAEVSSEANPDSVGAAELAGLKAAGFARVSFGMASSGLQLLKPVVLTPAPARPPRDTA